MAESDEERQMRLRLERACTEMTRMVDKVCPRGVGFVLLLFDAGDKGNLAYASNGKHEDMIWLLTEVRDKLRGQG